MHTTYTGPNEQALLPNAKVTANESTVIRNGTSKAEWIIYTLCITGCFFLTGFGHWFRTYRKRRSFKVRTINEKAVSEPLTPFMGDDTEVDKKLLTCVTTGSNVTPQLSNNETINFVVHQERQSNTDCIEDDEAGYLDLYFAMKEDVNHQVKIMHCERKAFQEYCQEESHACEISVTVHERQSNTACNEDDEAGYFDLYFAMKEDVNHQEVETYALRKGSLSSSSFNSNVVNQDKTEFHKPLQENCQEDSHACEVSFPVHQCIKRSSLSEEDDASNKYSNVYQLLQKDRQLNSLANGNRLSPDSNTVHDKTLQTTIPSTYRTGNLQDCTNKYAESEKIIDACGSFEFNKDKSISEEKVEDTLIGTTSKMWNTEPVLLQNETISTKETTVLKSGTSISEWIILTLCITGCFILTGFGYLIRTYRKRLSFKLRNTNEGAILEPLEPSPYIGVYDEINENPLTLDTTDLNLTSQESHYETIDLVSQERLYITTTPEHGDTGYLDPYFAFEEDENHQLEDRISQKENFSTTSNSSNSDVVDQDDTAENNLYQPLQGNWQGDSHGYDVPVMVHKCFKNSAEFDKNDTSNSYYNVYKPLPKDWDLKSPTYENQKSPVTKAGTDERLLVDDSSSVFKTDNLHDYINMNADSNISINNCDEIESCKPFDQDKLETIEQKSFCCDFDFKVESKNSCLNNICCSQEDDNSHSYDYDDAKSCI
ncbi:unnamed protein product [Mytilus coruscus]|uniref:Uncharacterized protein n=1 Tax=Mytilus coruscus TaxID=42192 RepID=A0A6J8BDP1_MYTCO|nr:unnamed protein product [Mytilus coruscus]